MTIRPATLDDIADLYEMAEKMHAEAPAYQGWQFDAEKVVALLTRLIEGAGCLLVSESDGVIVGGIAGVCVEHWFSRDLIATDLALFIDRERRNGTTAIRLVNGFAEWARLKGAKRVNMGITTGVHPEVTGRLYMAAGFIPSGSIFSREL